MVKLAAPETRATLNHLLARMMVHVMGHGKWDLLINITCLIFIYILDNTAESHQTSSDNTTLTSDPQAAPSTILVETTASEKVLPGNESPDETSVEWNNEEKSGQKDAVEDAIEDKLYVVTRGTEVGCFHGW